MPSSAWNKRSEEHTSELQSPCNLVCRLLLEKEARDQPPHHPGPRRRHHTAGGTAPSTRVEDTDNGEATQRNRKDGATAQLAATFFFNDTATTEIYTLSLHDALPI